jgi:multiple sugar transport system substrate-binding protein
MKMNLKRFRVVLALLVIATLTGVLGAWAQDDKVLFMSTQFNTVEESEKARAILEGFEGEAEYVGSDEGPMIDLLRAEGEAGTGTVSVIGALHGTFGAGKDDLVFDMPDAGEHRGRDRRQRHASSNSADGDGRLPVLHP